MEYPAREDETGDLSKCEYSQTGTLGSARCSHPGEFESGEGLRLCLFHWDPEDAKGRRLKDGIFNVRFSELVFDFEVHHEDTSFGVRLDCRGFVFPEGFSFFNGRVVPPADFHFARFACGTQFIRATFTEGARFHWAEFGENAHFDEANLGDGASFGGAILGERISFDRAIFGAAASFIRAKFGAGACFSGPASDGAPCSMERISIATPPFSEPNSAKMHRSKGPASDTARSSLNLGSGTAPGSPMPPSGTDPGSGGRNFSVRPALPAYRLRGASNFAGKKRTPSSVYSSLRASARSTLSG